MPFENWVQQVGTDERLGNFNVLKVRASFENFYKLQFTDFIFILMTNKFLEPALILKNAHLAKLTDKFVFFKV